MPSWWRERPRDVGKPSKVAATSPMLVMMVNMLVMMVNMPRRPKNSFKGGERGGQHADPDQWDDGPVERDQSQVFVSFSDTFCSE